MVTVNFISIVVMLRVKYKIGHGALFIFILFIEVLKILFWSMKLLICIKLSLLFSLIKK